MSDTKDGRFLKGVVEKILMNEKGHRELVIQILSEDEPDWRDVIKKQVLMEIKEEGFD